MPQELPKALNLPEEELFLANGFRQELSNGLTALRRLDERLAKPGTEPAMKQRYAQNYTAFYGLASQLLHQVYRLLELRAQHAGEALQDLPPTDAAQAELAENTRQVQERITTLGTDMRKFCQNLARELQ